MRILENWDVSSLYPNLVRLYGYSSRNQQDKDAYVNLLDMRMKAKKGQLTEDCHWCLHNPMLNEEREEENMNKVLKLYEERKLKEINDKYAKKVEDDYNAIEVVKQYNELVMNFESKLEELFNSLDNFDNGYLVTQCDSNCYKYTLSEGIIKNKIANKYAEEKIADKLELDKLIGEVDAQLSLSDDLTYQLEVLSRYNINNKKTNKMKV